MSKKNQENKNTISLSAIIDVDQDHKEAYLCSTKHIWDKNGLKESAKNGLPINFRVINKTLSNFSASGIFTKLQLRNAFNYIKENNPHVKNIYVVDLMKEYHGFIDYCQNAIPFSWRADHNTVNFGVDYKDVERKESSIISKMKGSLYDKPINIISLFLSSERGIEEILQTIKINQYKTILSEKDLAQNEGLKYLRFPCIDYSSPSYQSIIDFARFIQNIYDPKTDWLHIHCHGGKGRSTSVSLIFDMFTRLQNSTLGNVSFVDLMKFHHDSGGRDLEDHPSDIWKHQLSVDRYNLLGKIYKFLLEIDKYGLKDVYSAALSILLLNDANELKDKTFSSIIRDSGEVVQDIVCSSKDIESKLYHLYLNPESLDMSHFPDFNWHDCSN